MTSHKAWPAKLAVFKLVKAPPKHTSTFPKTLVTSFFPLHNIMILFLILDGQGIKKPIPLKPSKVKYKVALWGNSRLVSMRHCSQEKPLCEISQGMLGCHR